MVENTVLSKKSLKFECGEFFSNLNILFAVVVSNVKNNNQKHVRETHRIFNIITTGFLVTLWPNETYMYYLVICTVHTSLLQC